MPTRRPAAELDRTPWAWHLLPALERDLGPFASRSRDAVRRRDRAVELTRLLRRTLALVCAACLSVTCSRQSSDTATGTARAQITWGALEPMLQFPAQTSCGKASSPLRAQHF
jgi:hypothetical protein